MVIRRLNLSYLFFGFYLPIIQFNRLIKRRKEIIFIKMKRIHLISMMLFWVSTVVLNNKVFANGLVISNTSLTGQNTSAQTWQVRFNVTWNNSWKDNVNWDAVWIFCKYRVGTNAWGHATLSSTGFQTGSGTPINIIVTCDQRGAFISRRDMGSGTLSTTQIELRWNYGANGVLNSDVPDLNVYGIEMVYVPGGPFTIGDGNGLNSSSSNALFAVTQHLPYTIDNLMSPNIGAAANLTNASSTPADRIRIDGDGGLDINLDDIVDSASFPTGFRAFYLQKYEMTQGQYTDFLNTLTYTQQTNHVNNATNVVGQSCVDATVGVNPSRNTIIVQTAGTNSTVPRVYATSRPDRGITHLNFGDMLAYLDWAALRPITELEFEKACRGPLPAVLGDYAWGSTTVNSNSSPTLSGTENGTEVVTTPTGVNMWSSSNTVSQGDAGSGPLRVGIQATSSSSKYSAGASFYGLINMNDMGNEVVVTIGNVAGRSYRGTNGDGLLNTNGYADVAHWPGASGSNTVTNAMTLTNTGSTGAAGLFLKSSTGSISTRSTTPYSSVPTRTSTPGNFGTMRGARMVFSGEFSPITANGVVINPNQATPFSPASEATSYSWTFSSGTPSTSTSALPSVSWATPGTYNVSLTSTQGACSSTISSVVEVFAACSSPAILSGNANWSQNNTSYNNANSNNPRNLFDGNTTTTFQNTASTGYTWAIADLGAITSLNGVGIFNFNTSTSWSATDFILEGSNSLTGPWSGVAFGTPAVNIAAFQDFIFPEASYRYWKISFANFNSTTLLQVYEVRFNRCN